MLVKPRITPLLYLVVLLSCNPFQEELVFIPEGDKYYFYNDKRIAFINEGELLQTISRQSVPQLAEQSFDGENFVFYHQHRNSIYYNPLIFPDESVLRGFDYEFYIEITNVNASDQVLGYTNESLTNINFYFYEILKPVVRINDNASLYLAKINEDEWRINLNYADFNYQAIFTRQ